MTILLDEYFQDTITNYGYEPTTEERVRCGVLLSHVDDLVRAYMADTYLPEPGMTSGHRCRAKTLHLIEQGYHAAVGGQHELANAIDLADPSEHLENWITDARLTQFGLFREAPSATHGWVHLQTVPPRSGFRTFNP